MNKFLKSMIVLKFGTAEDFSKAVGERSYLISKVIRGRQTIPFEKKIEWANALGCSVNEIFPD
jgi:hypothetical protein